MTNFHEHIFGLIGYFFKRNIFNILTGQKRDVTELKLVWPVNKTGHYPKIICSPGNIFFRYEISSFVMEIFRFL